VIDTVTQASLRDAIRECISHDRSVLDELRGEIRSLRAATRPIHPRATTSISLVATDGGNNQLQFDPFLIQLIRVVDSSENEYVLEAVSPTTPVHVLTARQFNLEGSPSTALGEMMVHLGVTSLSQLSPMIRPGEGGVPRAPSWVGVYRELVEWATLFKLLTKDFGTDTLIVFDGFLRSKVFTRDLFARLVDGMRVRIEEQFIKSKRKVYLAGVAKRSKVIDRYRLAMFLERVLVTDYPAYVTVPRDIEAKAYIWNEYARGNEAAAEGGEANKFVGGKMFLVKFGSSAHDPIWPIDVFEAQEGEAQAILGSMLADAVNGFPVPLYPRCLQKAHEHAAIVGFDIDMLQDAIVDEIRTGLGVEAAALDAMLLQDADPAGRRYR
jgi:hypothetical protein